MRTSHRRTLRTLTVITSAVALVLGVSTTVSVPAAVALTDTEGVGAPQRFLIENVHASGKVLEIGNERAQLTGPAGDEPAAAAIFARRLRSTSQPR
jgi:hypothetical protein